MTTRLIHTPSGFVSPDDIDHSAFAPPGPAAPISSEPRVYGSVTRYNTGSPSAPSEVSQARHVHNPSAGTSGGSVTATLSATYGRPSVELIPGDPSSRTSVETALREGLIRRTAAGFEDVTADDGKQATLQGLDAPAEDSPADPGAGVFDAEDDALWAEDIGPLPQHAFDSASASVVAVVAHGMGSFEDSAKSLAASAGITPELALDYITQGYALHERAVARALAPLGLTGDRLAQAYESFKGQPAKLQDAIQRLAYQRDVGGFRDLAVAFKVSNPADTSAFKAAGFETTIDRETGDVMLKRPGGNWVKASDLK